MSEIITLDPSQYPDISQLVQEDDTPLDSFIAEKQQRLLTEVLYGYQFSSGVPFIVAANVGLFRNPRQPALVPDVFLSLNVTAADEWWGTEVRSYLLWEFGKAPEVVIEIVSPTPGGELDRKLRDYAQMGVIYYVVYDPLQELSDRVLQIFQLQAGRYVPITETWLPAVGLGLTLWQGVFEAVNDTWLRWCDESGNVIPTVEELAAQLSQTQGQLSQTQGQLSQTQGQLSQTAAQLSQTQGQLSQTAAQLSQTAAQLSQAEAQLAAERERTKQALLQGIELGLRLKFGSSGAILEEIAAINDVTVLQAIASNLPAANNLEEVRQIYQPNS